jgi:hypothetical protein
MEEIVIRTHADLAKLPGADLVLQTYHWETGEGAGDPEPHGVARATLRLRPQLEALVDALQAQAVGA